MKSSNIQPGVKATTKLNGRDQVVTVIGASLGTGGRAQWIVRTPAGNNVYRTARQLRAVVAPLNSPVDVGASHVFEYNLRRAYATLADGIDAVEDRAHEQAMSDATPAPRLALTRQQAAFVAGLPRPIPLQGGERVVFENLLQRGIVKVTGGGHGVALNTESATTVGAADCRACPHCETGVTPGEPAPRPAGQYCTSHAQG